MDAKTLARIGAIAFVAAAITATVIELTRKEERSEVTPARQEQVRASDPLQDELFRCQSLGEAGPRDPACLRAWAESRRRFLMRRTKPSTSPSGASRPTSETRGEGAAPSGE
ncbi:putative entry exclusion protein TrbK-alt [Mesorhizobium koreense]|uniref:putative entry exclusion protein TrbK-alt n=1 Tax=Mesorhizobium koreense TaxID=3074855 RepID=UPI00287B8D03|nr:putative entry exclusion protein TrbK-alt [Mesorhizobium sp. WR6]